MRKKEKQAFPTAVFWKVSGTAKYVIGLAVGIVLVYSVLKVVEGHMLARLVDTIVQQDGQGFLQATIVMISVFGATLISFFFARYLAAQFSERINAKLQRAISKKVSQATDHAMHQNHSGDLISRMSSDANLFQEMLQQDLLLLINGITTAIVALIYLLYHNWLLTLMVLACLPVILIVAVILSQPVEKYTTKAQKALGEINTHAKEALSGAEMIRAFNLQSFFLRRFSGSETNWFRNTMKKGRQSVILVVFGILITFVPFMIVFGFGGYLVIQGQLTIGLLFAFIQLLNYIAFPLQELPTILGRVKAGTAGGKRLMELLDLSIEQQTGKKGHFDQPVLVRFDNVSFRYPGQKEHALDEISFTIEKGEKVAFVGPSGCGKSTIFKLIQGDYLPQTGTITVGDTPLQAWSLSDLRDQTAVVVQEPFLFDTSIEENVSLGRIDSTPEEVNTAVAQAQMDRFVQELPEGMRTRAGELGARFSGGQRQRLCVARAMIRNAPLILMDEATSALDNDTEAQILRIIRDLPEEQTVVMIAHRLSPLAFVDWIVVLDQGRIVEQGTHDKLLEKNGRYASLFRAQMMEEADAS